MRKLAVISLAGTVLLGLNGCGEDVDSTDVRSSGIYAEITIDSDAPDQADVYANFRVGGASSNTFLDLKSGDQLTVILDNGEPRRFSREQDPWTKEIEYSTSFYEPLAGTQDSAYRVSLVRANDSDAPSSVVAIPVTLSNMALNPEYNFSRSNEDLFISWDAGANTSLPLQLDITGTCIATLTRTVNDTGSTTISSGSLTDSASGVGQSCPLTITLSYIVNGTLDPNYGEGGYIRAKKRVRANITTTP